MRCEFDTLSKKWLFSTVPQILGFFCKHNRTICEIACSRAKTILDKDIIDIFQDIDNEDENIKVLEMWQKNKNQDLVLTKTKLLCFKH